MTGVRSERKKVSVSAALITALKGGDQLTTAQLQDRTGFSRSAILLNLSRFEDENLVLRSCEGVGRDAVWTWVKR